MWLSSSWDISTGAPRGLATVHANSAIEGLTRLEDLTGEVTQRIPYRAMTQAINVIVYIKRTKAGAKSRALPA